MQCKKTHMAIVFNLSVAYLPGIVDPTIQVKTKHRDGMKDQSPYQRKIFSLFRFLTEYLKTPEGEPVFYSVCPTLTGPHSGELMVCSYRRESILAYREKILVSPIAWLYSYLYERAFIDPSCLNRAFKGCDAEEVALITDTDWVDETDEIITPFHDETTEFLQGAEADGLVLDMSALRQDDSDDDEPNPRNSAPTANQEPAPENREEFARRLGLRDDATFTSAATDHVSRVTGATANTNGADTFRSADTAEQRRSFRDQRLELARQRAAAIAASISNNPTNPTDESHTQGQSSSIESAASAPENSDADLPEDNRGGGASA